MALYTEYLDQRPNLEQLTALRKEQLRRIGELRGGRDVIVIAADLRASGNGPNPSLEYGDILPVADLLREMGGASVDVILETPGGSGEVAEEIVWLLYDKYVLTCPQCGNGIDLTEIRRQIELMTKKSAVLREEE